MPLKQGEIEHRIVDFEYKIEYPDGKEVKAGLHQKRQASEKKFEGYKAGLSANATLFRTESKLSDKWDATVATSGPSLGGSIGVKYGEETGLAAIVEPTLVKVDGKVGPVCATFGLNGTTGVQITEEGFKVGLMGFGITYGIGRRYSIDTPIASGGISRSSSATDTETEETESTVNGEQRSN